MQEDLSLLLELSRVDKKVHELKLTKKDLPTRIQTLKEEIERGKTDLEKTTQAIDETKAKIAENQDIVVQEEDCKDKVGTYIFKEDSDRLGLSFAARSAKIFRTDCAPSFYAASTDSLTVQISLILFPQSWGL